MKATKRVTVWVMSDEGEVDVTEPVEIAYDALIQSMDFSSGFLDREEELAIAELARALGAPIPEFPHDACSACTHSREMHSSLGEKPCNLTGWVREPVYERKQIRTASRVIPADVESRMKEAMKLAQTATEVRLLAAAAETMAVMVEDVQEVSHMVDPGETKRCECDSFQ